MRFPVDVPVLSDGVIRLRAHEERDVEALQQMCRDPEFARWTSVPQPYTPEHAKRFVRDVVPAGWVDGTYRSWAIEAVDDSGTARFAGNVDVRGVPIADLGFGLHPWARGRGVMSRAVRLAAEWAFGEGGVAVLHWRCRVGNLPSRRVAWACGFSFQGTVPKLLAERGEVLDAWVGSLLPGADMVPRTRWLEPVRLQGERVMLRPFAPADVPRIVEACSDPRSRHWLSGLPHPYTQEHARDYVLGREVSQSIAQSVTWAMADPRTDVLLGDVGLMGLDGEDRSAGEVGYWAHPDARGHGLMTEAVRLVVGHAFRPPEDGGLGLRRLALAAAVGNTASRHVAGQAGFTHVGTHRQAEVLGDGSYADLLWFDRLAVDGVS